MSKPSKTSIGAGRLERVRTGVVCAVACVAAAALAAFCDLREAYPCLSLRDLGEMADPLLSKSALCHRVLRL